MVRILGNVIYVCTVRYVCGAMEGLTNNLMFGIMLLEALITVIYKTI